MKGSVECRGRKEGRKEGERRGRGGKGSESVAVSNEERLQRESDGHL
jgi:hypothetical protein